MKPPADRLLDLNGAGSDLPAPARPRYGLRGTTVFAAATGLTLVSSALALQFTGAIAKPSSEWGTIIVLNAAYWYTWALFTPAIVWLSQHFRLERPGLLAAALVHAPAVVCFSFGHIAAMAAVRWWLAVSHGGTYSWWTHVQRATLETVDWEMMTYWAIAGLSHAVLYYRESRARELRASQLETRLVAARMAALRQQLQPHFLFNTLHAVSSLMHRDVEAADRMLMRLSDLLRMTLDHVGQPNVTLQTELDFVSRTSTSSRPASPTASTSGSTSTRRPSTRSCRRSSSSRLSRTPSNTGWPGRPDPAISRSRPGATTTCCASRSATTAPD